MNTDAAVQYFQSNPWLLAALVAWSIIWKAFALWHAARNSQLAWYIILIIVNTVGILSL